MARPPPREAAEEHPAPRADGRDHPAAHGGGGLPRHPDADPLQVDARGRARLRRAEPAAQGHVLRAPAEPADPEAADDDRGLRPLLPDRDLLPGRGPPGRPRAGDHPARRRDELPRPRGALRLDGGDVRDHLARVPRRRDPDPVAAAHVRGGRPPLRHGQAGPAVRAGARGRDRGDARVRVRRLRECRGRALSPRSPHLLARRARDARGAREGARREGPRVRHPRRGAATSARRSRSSSPRRSSRRSRPRRARRCSSPPTTGTSPRACSATCGSTSAPSSA